jgi:hypothetical protein
MGFCARVNFQNYNGVQTDINRADSDVTYVVHFRVSFSLLPRRPRPYVVVFTKPKSGLFPSHKRKEPASPSCD